MISDDVDITKVGSNIDDEASVNTNNIPKTRYIDNSSNAFRYLASECNFIHHINML